MRMRFLGVRIPKAPPVHRIEVVFNWFDKLKRQVAAGRWPGRAEVQQLVTGLRVGVTGVVETGAIQLGTG